MSEGQPDKQNRLVHLLTHALFALGFGVALFILLLSSFIAFYQLKFNERIFPGVHVQDLNIGGLTIEEAAVHLTQSHQFTDSGEYHLKYLDNTIPVYPEELGLHLDAVSTAVEAYRFGRSLPISKWLLHQALIFAPHIEIAPAIIFDEESAASFLAKLSHEHDQPMAEARLQIIGTKVFALPGKVGQALDVESSLLIIHKAINYPELGIIELRVDQESPALIDASEFIPLAQEVLDHSFVINMPLVQGVPEKEWTITPENLAPMLTFITDSASPSSIIPQFNDELLDNLLTSFAEQINTEPENARFIFNDDTMVLDLLDEGKNGYSIDVNASKLSIQNALASGKHSTELTFDFHPPEVDSNALGEDLGITELVHTESSYFFGSDPDRIHNIETAAAEFHGLLIPPGETFSMASAMDEISLDNGYAEALIIFNGKTIKGIGGGVCQVSTTLFRTAFFAGFPIIERYPHAYRVSYYEKTANNVRNSSLAGLDATVYIPLVDLKFNNDTPNWLLMETYLSRPANRLTWKFYSTRDGRTLDWKTTGPVNVVKSEKPLCRLNKKLASGEIKQIEWEADGADVTVERVVYKDSEELFEDSFFTRYAPWRAVYEHGPGTECNP